MTKPSDGKYQALYVPFQQDTRPSTTTTTGKPSRPRPVIVSVFSNQEGALNPMNTYGKIPVRFTVPKRKPLQHANDHQAAAPSRQQMMSVFDPASLMLPKNRPPARNSVVQDNRTSVTVNRTGQHVAKNPPRSMQQHVRPKGHLEKKDAVFVRRAFTDGNSVTLPWLTT